MAAAGRCFGAELLAARTLQGVGAALIVPQILATLHVTLKGTAHARAISLYGGIGGIAFIIGQMGGGWLVSADIAGLGWRNAFFINVPICLLVLVLRHRHACAGAVLPIVPDGARARAALAVADATDAAAWTTTAAAAKAAETGQYPVWPADRAAVLYLLVGLYVLHGADAAVGHGNGAVAVREQLYRHGYFVFCLSVVCPEAYCAPLAEYYSAERDCHPGCGSAGADIYALPLWHSRRPAGNRPCDAGDRLRPGADCEQFLPHRDARYRPERCRGGKRHIKHLAAVRAGAWPGGAWGIVPASAAPKRGLFRGDDRVPGR
ncbi:putative MFS-type transporter [Beauveria bassiana D1-5]|uniref:Putative MFS-type transporter n=1 Tax=Beauveria bassiana D1-5 TaxID=1245745 RepID=A0A0A2VEP8_BEABA|nr:putative MFS-type transporter [Beauveria bassiana D1-5]